MIVSDKHTEDVGVVLRGHADSLLGKNKQVPAKQPKCSRHSNQAPILICTAVALVTSLQPFPRELHESLLQATALLLKADPRYQAPPPNKKSLSVTTRPVSACAQQKALLLMAGRLGYKNDLH